MKKTKVGLLATLAATSAIVPTLSAVSCGKTNTQVNKIGEEFDKEYGVNEAVYTKLKTEFVRAVGEQAKQLGRDEERARASARQACSAFDARFKQSQNLSYTAVTNSLMEYASRTYNIKLTRVTQKKVASWDDLTIAFDGMAKSMDGYMASSGLNPQARQIILNSARDAFNGENGLVSRIRANYADPLLGLIHAKGQLLSCFADVNEDIGLVAAANRLKDFMSDYSIDYDFNKVDNSNKLDKLEEKAWFKEGADLSEDSNILKIYTITRKSDGKVLDSFEADKVCPGYTIKPVLKKVNKDPRKNVYSLDIDWTAVKTNYLTANDTERAEKTTAHYYKGGFDGVDLSDTSSAYKMLMKANDDASVNYPIYLTKEGEKTALEETYLNPSSKEGQISFGWDIKNPEKNAFDALFSGVPVDKASNDGTHEYIVNHDSLAKAGLTLSFSVPNSNGLSQATERLDKIVAVSGANSQSSEIAYQSGNLLKDFLDNCNIWGDVKPQGTETSVTGTYTSTNSVYVTYQNTKYPQTALGRDADINVIYNETYNDKFTVSKSAYDYLIGEFNQQKDFLDVYTQNQYEDEYNSAVDDVILESLFLTLSVLFTIQTTALCFVPVFAGHIPIYIVLLILTWISMGGQVAILWLLVNKKLIPIKRFKEDCDGIKNNKLIQKFDEIVIQSQKDNFLCRYDDECSIAKKDYDDGLENFQKNSDFFIYTLPAMKFYQNIAQQQEFQDLLVLIKKAKISPEDYQEEMHVWDEGGVCQKASKGLMISTAALDITTMILMAFTPEMSDWEFVKQLSAEAREKGWTFKTLYEHYRMTKILQEEMKYLREMGVIAGDISKITPQEANDILKIYKSASAFSNAENFVNAKIPGFAEYLEKEINASKTLEEGMKDVDHLRDLGDGGFSVIAYHLSHDVNGEVTNAGLEYLLKLTDSLSDALRASTGLGEAVKEGSVMEGFVKMFKGLKYPEDAVAVELAVGEIPLRIAEHDWDKVYSLLDDIDEIFCHVENFTEALIHDPNAFKYYSKFIQFASDTGRTFFERLIKSFRQSKWFIRAPI